MPTNRPANADRFLWGCASSSYQIEGAVRADGRGPSIWDTFSHTPGKIAGADTGDVACDHYHRMDEDLDLMADLGVQSYRFSIAWPRIQPTGVGAPLAAGLDFYDRLVDGLLARGISPMATCYHWDLPQALEDRGGWRVRGTAEAFAQYCSIVASRLGDRVPHWCTINEPWCSWWLGYVQGNHAPGAQETGRTRWQIAHNLMLAHGLGTRAIRAAVPPQVKVGMAFNTFDFEPFAEEPEHIAAARNRYERENAWLLGTMMRGEYPRDRFAELGADAPEVAPGDMAAIAAPLDFVGLNIYQNRGLTHAQRGQIDAEPWHPRTDFDWAVTPDCLYWGIRFAHEVFGVRDIMITENGCCYPDVVDAHGRVDDVARIAYLKGHLRGVERARREGLPVTGYYLWSILDNFEWAEGYGKRFGIVHVDFKTLKRTPKASFEWYRSVIRRDGVEAQPAAIRDIAAAG